MTIKERTMHVKLFTDDIESLRPSAKSWEEITHGNSFGIDISIDKFLSGLKDMADGDDSDLLVLYDDEPIGFIGLQYFISPLGNQKMANEHFFFVVPEKRGLSSMRLLRDAKALAKKRGCSHFIMNASNLASDMHDKVCNLYERLDMKKFETSFISEV
jgi:GNAT superfamily N-acetyltransferase